MSAAAILTVLKDGETIKSCPIEGEALLGRSEGCVIRLEDRAISRMHAVFRVTSDGVQVEKKSEFAPVLVNGAEMATRAIVRDADVISIGPYLMRVTVSGGAREEASEAADPPKERGALEDLATHILSEQLPDLGAVPDPAEPAPAVPAAQPGPNGTLPELALDAAGGLELGQPEEGASPPADLGGLLETGAEGAIELAPQGEEAAAEPAGQVREESHVPADEDAKTRVVAPGKLNVRLVFAPGTANVTEYDIAKDEISVGRGKDCDIVLNDKKSSRRHALIRRSGGAAASFVLKDLGSANGTYVNGRKLASEQEQELEGEDLIRIGNVEFTFKAESADYKAREAGFMKVDEAPSAASSDIPVMDDPALLFDHSPGTGTGLEPNVPQYSDPALADAPLIPGGAASLPGAIPGIPGSAPAGITGIGPGDAKQMSLFEKVRNFKTLPTKDKIVVTVIVGGLLYFLLDLMEPEPEPEPPKPKAAVAATGAAGEKPSASFESLSPEQKRFVEAQHELALSYFTNKEYDRAIDELEKIFKIIPDYKNSIDIMKYAKEGKRRLEAAEEERRRKEDEARLKLKIMQLEDECAERMKKKEYEQARELFAQISVLDPDNAKVAEWKKEIEEFEEGKRLKEQGEQVQSEINKRAWEVYREGMALKKKGKLHSAIAVFVTVADIGASDKSVTGQAARRIKECREAIRAAREPVLAEAKQAEGAQEYPKAFELFRQATRIDPPHPEGYAGMNRIRGILHDRAKAIYVEAVLAESYSDFAVAKKKFKECLEVAPPDDIYHQRAERKLRRFFRKEDQGS